MKGTRATQRSPAPMVTMDKTQKPAWSYKQHLLQMPYLHPRCIMTNTYILGSAIGIIIGIVIIGAVLMLMVQRRHP